MDEEDQAIPTADAGESYTPATPEGPPAPAQQAAPSGAEAAIPDVGEAPFGSREGKETVGQGLKSLGEDAMAGLSRGVDNARNSAPARGVKAIVSYLMGAGGTPHLLDQKAAEADPTGSMSEGDRNIMAVHQAAEMDGPAAAWALVQGNRVAYNAKQAFAYAALNGGQQKPADLNASIQAANQAADHVLDGSSVKFAPGQGGVTATVMSPGSDQPQTYNLTTDQYREYLNVGRTGQWDRLMQDGIPGTLQKISQHNPRGQVSPAGRIPQPALQAQPPRPPKQINFGNTPSTMNLSGNQDAIPDSESEDKTAYDPRLEARAMKMFPSISQQGERQQWMAGQEQNEDKLQNSVDVAKEQGINRVAAARETGNARRDATERASTAREKVADTTGQARVKSAEIRVNGQNVVAAMKAANDGNKAAQVAVDQARKAIAVKRQTGERLTPEDIALENQMTQRAAAPRQQQAAPQAPTPQAPTPQAPQAQQPPVPGAKLFKGQWYTRGPNGESVPVQ